jgi:NAD(P)H-flavin reductase
MRKDIYEKICQGSTIELNSENEDNIHLSIKDYKTGLSQRFKQREDTYNIKGPMGKGLGLNHNSKGQHFAFAAGTGVLVFVDLVARILLGVRG